MELKSISMKWVFQRTVSGGIGMIFLFSGLLKLEDVDAFIGTVLEFDLLPVSVVPTISHLIIVTELVCGAMLVCDFRRKIASSILSIMMFVFTLAVMIVLFNGEEKMCGCFGDRFSNQIDRWTVIRNIVLMILLVVVNRTDTQQTPLH